ncbi:hypothetical protein NHQ30_008287 [Ciborinia camelliae]|nr:hypothetical protein NHQ30_008287 [Ciborinia camelliae]
MGMKRELEVVPQSIQDDVTSPTETDLSSRIGTEKNIEESFSVISATRQQEGIISAPPPMIPPIQEISQQCSEEERTYPEGGLQACIVGGLAGSLLFTPSIATVGHWFLKKRGNATGIAATGGAFGGIVFPLLLQSLIPKIGFAWTTRVMGFIMLTICIIANLLIRSRLPPIIGARSTGARSPHPDFKIFAQPAFALTVLGVYLLEWALFIPLTYITSYALYEGFSDDISYQQTLPILCAGSILGRFIPGLISDTIGRFNTMLVALFLTTFACFIIWLPFGNTYPGLILFAIVLGFGSGSNISLAPVCVGQLCDTQDYGRYYATCYTVVSFGCLTGVPIAGALVEACHGAYWGLILFTGCCYAASTVAMAGARGFGGGWRLKLKF